MSAATKETCSLAEAASRLGVDRLTCYRILKANQGVLHDSPAGKVVAFKIGSQWRVPLAPLERLLGISDD